MIFAPAFAGGPMGQECVGWDHRCRPRRRPAGSAWVGRGWRRSWGGPSAVIRQVQDRHDHFCAVPRRCRPHRCVANQPDHYQSGLCRKWFWARQPLHFV